MALLSSSSSAPLLRSTNLTPVRLQLLNIRNISQQSTLFFTSRRNRIRFRAIVNSELCIPETLTLDRDFLDIKEACLEDELWSAACLRVRTFFVSKQETYALDDHIKFLAEREFEALKERIAGKRIGFKRVSCINATVPISQMSTSSDGLSSTCKYSDNGRDRVVIGSLDLNQCLSLPDEIAGKRPEGVGLDTARAYLSNVCVAKVLQKNGVGSSLVAKSKKVAKEWGITDLYVHVAVDNEPARKLYLKNGFTYENDEPAWQARFLDRPRRILLWTDLSSL